MTPSDASQHLEGFFASHPSVKHVALNLNDYSNGERARLMSKRQSLETCADLEHPSGANGPGPIMWAITRLQSLVGAVLINRGEEDGWIPDWFTIIASAKDETLAEVQCSAFAKLRRKSKETSEVADGDWEKVEGPQGFGIQKDDSDGFAGDARKILQRVEEDVKERHGIEFLAGIEIEFVLLADMFAEEPITLPNIQYSTEAFREKASKVILEAAAHLEENGIRCWNYHQEFTGDRKSGKFELSLAPMRPSHAADAVLHTIRTIKDVAKRHGYFATMQPHALEVGPTVGQHIHFSLSRKDLADQFLAGMLNRLEEMTAFFLGGYDSYAKARELMYGKGWTYWSLGKIAPIKEAGEAHWEVRTPDTNCIPHLQLAAMICSGMEGIEKSMKLAKPRNFFDLQKMTDEQRKKEGINTIPRSLADAAALLKERKEWWISQMGEECIEGYIINKQAEAEQSVNMTYRQRADAFNYGPPTLQMVPDM